jgi:hypothetical protein
MGAPCEIKKEGALLIIKLSVEWYKLSTKFAQGPTNQILLENDWK